MVNRFALRVLVEETSHLCGKLLLLSGSEHVKRNML